MLIMADYYLCFRKIWKSINNENLPLLPYNSGQIWSSWIKYRFRNRNVKCYDLTDFTGPLL